VYASEGKERSTVQGNKGVFGRAYFSL